MYFLNFRVKGLKFVSLILWEDFESNQTHQAILLHSSPTNYALLSKSLRHFFFDWLYLVASITMGEVASFDETAHFGPQVFKG